MKIRVTTYIAPRQSGKTSMFAVPILLKDPQNTILITDELSSAKYINKLSGTRRCFPQEHSFKGMKSDLIVLDDGLFFTNKNNERFMYDLYEVLLKPNGSCGEIIIISTSNRVYDIDVLNAIKWLKEEEKYDSDNLVYDVCNILYGGDVDVDIVKEIEEECSWLEWSFLTYPFSKIISLDYLIKEDDERKKQIGQDSYELEILNKWNNKK